jgi:hypothetical protein
MSLEANLNPHILSAADAIVRNSADGQSLQFSLITILAMISCRSPHMSSGQEDGGRSISNELFCRELLSVMVHICGSQIRHLYPNEMEHNGLNPGQVITITTDILRYRNSHSSIFCGHANF